MKNWGGQFAAACCNAWIDAGLPQGDIRAFAQWVDSVAAHAPAQGAFVNGEAQMMFLKSSAVFWADEHRDLFGATTNAAAPADAAAAYMHKLQEMLKSGLVTPAAARRALDERRYDPATDDFVRYPGKPVFIKRGG